MVIPLPSEAEKIDNIIAGLTDDRAVGIQTVFGGALSKDKLKEWRKHFNEPDDLTPALDATLSRVPEDFCVLREGHKFSVRSL